jgi:two-component system response regulator AtoC
MKRVLVLDDEFVVRQLMVEILERAGYAVEAAARPLGALEQVARGSFDVLVTDLVMPELSGLDVLRRVKEQAPGLPVVLVTGQGTEENLARAKELGAAAVLEKPFSHAQLRDAVASVLEGR